MSEFLVSLNPLNQEPVGQVPITSRSELTEIVGRSRIAQANWGRLSLEERATRLRDAYHALASAQNQLARLISLEMGKDARRATYEVAGTVTNAPYFIEEAAAVSSIGRLGLLPSFHPGTIHWPWPTTCCSLP